jgi:uncharacterized membrane protein/cytochrome c2
MVSFPWLEAHGGVTHFPVALLIMALVFDLGAALFRKREWRTVGFWLLLAGVVMAVPAIFTGWMTARHLFGGGTARPPAELTLHWRMAVLTAVLAIALLAWRIARRDEGAGRSRAAMIGLSSLVALSVGITGYLGGDMALGGAGAATADATAPNDLTAAAVARNRRVYSASMIAAGHKLVVDPAIGCQNCHRIDGTGGKVGPDLSRIGLSQPDITWQLEHLKDPQSVKPGSAMPSFDSLTPEQRQAIAAWIVTRDGSGK